MPREPASGPVLLLGALGLLALFVFAVLPRWTAPPVVTVAPAPIAAAVPRAEPAAPPVTSPVPLEPAPASGLEHAAAPRETRSAPGERPAPSAAPDEWSATVSLGLAALDRGAFAEAQDAFLRAEALRPGSTAVADGLARARAALLEQTLRERRLKAEAAEAREEWRAALVEYDAALGLEPAVSFAVAGKLRCLERAALDERLQRYLDKPERLSTEAVAREAAAVLEQASEASPAGPRLVAQRAALEKLLAGAAQPVTVRLVSDGETQVTILRVGPLGAFKQKEVTLRPGSYVVLGARTGYRDARRTLLVPIGRSPAPLDVRCDEAL